MFYGEGEEVEVSQVAGRRKHREETVVHERQVVGPKTMAGSAQQACEHPASLESGTEAAD